LASQTEEQVGKDWPCWEMPASALPAKGVSSVKWRHWATVTEKVWADCSSYCCNCDPAPQIHLPCRVPAQKHPQIWPLSILLCSASKLSQNPNANVAQFLLLKAGFDVPQLPYNYLMRQYWLQHHLEGILQASKRVVSRTSPRPYVTLVVLVHAEVGKSRQDHYIANNSKSELEDIAKFLRKCLANTRQKCLPDTPL
jgi:hypothetical protein